MTDRIAEKSPKQEKNDPEFWADLQTFVGSDSPVLIEMWRQSPI